MNKRIILFVLVLTACALFSGCKKNETPDLSEKFREKAESVKEQERDTQETKTERKKKNAKEENVPKTDFPPVQSGEAVYYDGKVMFRVYSYSAYDFGALHGEFNRNEHAYQPNSIYTFDPLSPDAGITLLCEDYGYGDMFLINGEELYSQYTVEGKPDDYNYRVYKKHLPDGEPQEICNGVIKGFSPDGKHFVVNSYTTDPVYTQHYYIYSADDNDIDSAHFESSGTYLGMDDDAAYFLEENDGRTFDIIKLTNDGREYYLASCDFSKIDTYFSSYYPQYYGNFSFEDGRMSFQVDYYEGSGHFYCGSIKATVPVAAKGESFDNPLYDPELEEVTPDMDPDGFAIDPESVIPKRIEDTAYEYPAYDSGKGIAKVLQYYEELKEGIFYVKALCHRDPLNDIGWRESYSLQNVQYFFIGNDKDEPILLHTMFEPLGSRGSLAQYEYYETQPTIYAYTQFLADKDGNFAGLLYETINVEGPEMPIISSDVYHVAQISDKFYYEHPHNDELFDDFDVDGMKEFHDMIDSWIPKSDIPVKMARFNDDGTLFHDDNMRIEEGEGVYMCHLAFDDEGRVYYIRPVIMD